MKHRTSKALLNLISIVMVLTFSLFSAIPVFADEAAPPAPTEEPVQPPTEEPVATTEPVVESTEEVVSLPEVLEQLPEDTTVAVIVDGQVEPLATQDAADVIVTGDPMWCPDDATPADGVGGGCTPRQYSLRDLIVVLQTKSNGTDFDYSGAGTIYISYDYSADDTNATLTDFGQAIVFDYFTVGLSDLTVQGGWDFDEDSLSTTTPQSDLTGINRLSFWDWGGYGSPASLTINDIFVDGAGISAESWNNSAVGNVTLDTVSVNNSNVYGVYIQTNGGIALHSVTADGSERQGAYLDNCAFDMESGLCVGTGSITVDQNSTFNDNGVEESLNSGLYAASAGSITLSHVTANGNGTDGALLRNSFVGATGNINVSDSVFGEIENGNGDTGLDAYSNGSITLSTVTATWNEDEGASLDNCNYNEDTDECDGAGSITVDQNSTFNDNGYEGLQAYSNSSIILNNVFAYRNGSEGAYLDNEDGTGGITIGQSTFSDNHLEGLEADSNGSIALSDVTAEGNTNTGLMAYSYGGSITLNNVTANGNLFGADLEAADNVEVTQGTFNDNNWGGVYASSDAGYVTLDHVIASGNYREGVPGAVFDTTTGNEATVICSQFTNNGGYGVDGDDVDGVFTLNDVTFNGNTLGNYTGTPVITSGSCPPAPAGGGGNSDVFGGFIPATGNQDVLFIVIERTQDQLPGAIGNGNTFASALKVILTDLGKQAEDLSITLMFPIPNGMENASLTVHFWDGSGWVAVPGGSVVGGYFVITVSEPGDYVLVSQ